MTYEAIETISTEVKTGATPVNFACHISDHLEVPDMENWAEAVCMREQFRRKILHAKQMRKHSESLRFMNARMIEALSATDIRLTFRIVQ